MQLQRNLDGRTGDGRTSYPFSSWGRSPAEGWAGSWRRTEGLWDNGCGEANQGERNRKAKGITFSKTVQLPRVRPRTGMGVRGKTAETTRGGPFQMGDMKGNFVEGDERFNLLKDCGGMLCSFEASCPKLVIFPPKKC